MKIPAAIGSISGTVSDPIYVLTRPDIRTAWQIDQATPFRTTVQHARFVDGVREFSRT